MLNITKEEMIEMYITNNMSLTDICDKHNISYSAAKRLVKKYNIKKSRKSVSETTSRNNMKKYGVSSAMQRPDVREKARQTCLKHYGTDNPMKNKDIQAKAVSTNIEKYGVRYTCQNSDIRNKMNQTNLERYGSESPFGNEEIRNKSEQTKLEKYGTLKVSDNPIYQEHFLSEDSARQFIEENYKGYTINQLADELDYSASNMDYIINKYNLYDLIKLHSNTSSYEDEIENIIKSVGITNIIRNKKFKELNNLELDIYLPDYNVGIEFNGDYWHNETKKSRTYHQKKSLLGEKNNIFVYHIFEYEWHNEKLKEKIINQLRNLLQKNENKIYGRKCIIKEVSSKEKSAFLNKNHLQGNDRSTINLGLYYNDELVSLMTFVKSRFNKSYDWELSRFCSKANTTVIGAANKLFKYFVNNYLTGSIISYSNISKTRGNVYSILGFTLDHISDPNYVWWSKTDIKTRYQCQMKNEIETMQNKGYFRIYDSGNKVWVYKH